MKCFSLECRDVRLTYEIRSLIDTLGPIYSPVNIEIHGSSHLLRNIPLNSTASAGLGPWCIHSLPVWDQIW